MTKSSSLKTQKSKLKMIRKKLYWKWIHYKRRMTNWRMIFKPLVINLMSLRNRVKSTKKTISSGSSIFSSKKPNIGTSWRNRKNNTNYCRNRLWSCRRRIIKAGKRLSSSHFRTALRWLHRLRNQVLSCSNLQPSYLKGRTRLHCCIPRPMTI